VCISGSNAGYPMFRGSVNSTGYPLHSPVSPSLPQPPVRDRVPSHFSWSLRRNKMRFLVCHSTFASNNSNVKVSVYYRHNGALQFMAFVALELPHKISAGSPKNGKMVAHPL